MFKKFLESARMFWKVPEVSRKFRNVQECSIIFQKFLESSGMFQKVLECSRDVMESEIVDAMFYKYRSSKVYKAKFGAYASVLF